MVVKFEEYHLLAATTQKNFQGHTERLVKIFYIQGVYDHCPDKLAQYNQFLLYRFQTLNEDFESIASHSSPNGEL